MFHPFVLFSQYSVYTLLSFLILLKNFLTDKIHSLHLPSIVIKVNNNCSNKRILVNHFCGWSDYHFGKNEERVFSSPFNSRKNALLNKYLSSLSLWLFYRWNSVCRRSPSKLTLHILSDCGRRLILQKMESLIRAEGYA